MGSWEWSIGINSLVIAIWHRTVGIHYSKFNNFVCFGRQEFEHRDMNCRCCLEVNILAALWQPCVCERWCAVMSAPSRGNVMDTATSVRITDSTYLLTIIRRTKPDVSAPLIHKPCEWSASRLGSFTSVEWVFDNHWKEIWVCAGASLDTG